MTYMTKPKTALWTVKGRDFGQTRNKYSSEFVSFSSKALSNGIFREIKAAQHCIVAV